MFETIKTTAKAKAAVALTALGILVFGAEGYKLLSGSSKTEATTPKAEPAAEVIKAPENNDVTFKFTCQSTYVTSNGMLLLNNYVYRKGEQPPADGMTVVVPNCGMSREQAKQYRGKLIEAHGIRSSYNGKPQVRCNQMSDLKIQ